MQNLHIIFTSGPMQGESGEYQVGSLLIGREPHPEAGQPALMLRGAESAVSRNHAVLEARDGEVILRNLGSNGTRVNGSLVVEEAILNPGAVLGIGASHEFRLDWQVVGASRAGQGSGKKKPAANVASSGLLASPLVRALLVVYLVAIIAVAGWLNWRSGLSQDIPDDWPKLGAAYEEYQPGSVDEEEKMRRTRLAEALLVRLRVMRANEDDDGVRRLCRELMRLDADIESPLYRYGARCLGSIK